MSFHEINDSKSKELSDINALSLSIVLQKLLDENDPSFILLNDNGFSNLDDLSYSDTKENNLDYNKQTKYRARAEEEGGGGVVCRDRKRAKEREGEGANLGEKKRIGHAAAGRAVDDARCGGEEGWVVGGSGGAEEGV
ncbi:hypothetical protein L484_024377 [Morus notabilis]|uniref:Uncharacterized protein n=1 Tax=Morus notabilis TaxID=981085 RepID=W9RX61_9ROSA|nr:hypothetical protein L484_024377 [Morus notabilis]